VRAASAPDLKGCGPTAVEWQRARLNGMGRVRGDFECRENGGRNREEEEEEAEEEEGGGLWGGKGA
jgi:hypothetical protein